MATKPPTPHQRVIERFGGFAPMAAAVSGTAKRRLVPSTVQGWHRRGHISNNWQQAVLDAGRGLEPPLRPQDFFDAPAKGGLTQLGGGAAIAAGPGEAVLETVANPNPGEAYVVRFAAPEFTSLCPVTGQPDFAHLVVDYVPGKRIVESKSLKLFLASFRNHGAFHEDCTVAIARRIVAAAKPQWLRIGGYWYPRGGIPIDVFYQTGRPPAGVWLPDPGVQPYRGRG